MVYNATIRLVFHLWQEAPTLAAGKSSLRQVQTFKLISSADFLLFESLSSPHLVHRNVSKFECLMIPHSWYRQSDIARQHSVRIFVFV